MKLPSELTMAKILLAIFLLLFGCGQTHTSPAQTNTSTSQKDINPDAPPNWPWRGITISFEGSRINEGTGPDDIALLKNRLNINSARITLDVRTYSSRFNTSPEVAWETNLAWADRMLDACKAANITAILSISQFPIDPALGYIQDSPEFWNDQAQLDEVLRRVSLLAEHFKDRGEELGAYEVLNEPLLREDGVVKVPLKWPSMMEEIISNIRQSDHARWIVLTPGPGGLPSGYADFTPLQAERIIYGAHDYVPLQFTHQGIRDWELGYRYPGYIGLNYWDKKAHETYLEPLRSFQQKYSAYVWIGEFSAVRWAEGSEDYILDLAFLFDSYGWGWAYFNYGGYHGWNPDYDTGYATDDKSDWTTHYLGEESLRWTTLKKILGTE